MDVHHVFTVLPLVRRVSVVTSPRGFGTFMDFNFGFTYVFAGKARYRVENDGFTARRGHQNGRKGGGRPCTL